LPEQFTVDLVCSDKRSEVELSEALPVLVPVATPAAAALLRAICKSARDPTKRQ